MILANFNKSKFLLNLGLGHLLIKNANLQRKLILRVYVKNMLRNILFFFFTKTFDIFYFFILLEMYRSYQHQLALVHAQIAIVGTMTFYYFFLNIGTLELRSKTFGIQNLNLLNLTPWFVVMQFYILFIPKAVSRQ